MTPNKHVRNNFEERLEAVVVVRPPLLSDAERAILDLVPPERSGIHLGGPGLRAVTVTTVTIALFVVAVHTPTLTGGRTLDELRGRIDRVNLAASRVAQLKSLASVGELVALRQQLQNELF